jgi:hypothetical protein
MQSLRFDEVIIKRELGNFIIFKQWTWMNGSWVEEVVQVQAQSRTLKTPANHLNDCDSGEDEECPINLPSVSLLFRILFLFARKDLGSSEDA